MNAETARAAYATRSPERAAEVNEQINQARESIAAVRHRLKEVEAGEVRLPKAEAQAALTDWIGGMATRGREVLSSAAGAASLGRMSLDSFRDGGQEAFQDAVGLLVLGAEKELRKLSGAALDEAYTQITDTLPRAERQAHIDELRQQLLDLEKQEYALVQEAIQQGYKTTPRPDTDPRVLLGVTTDFKRYAP